MFSYFGYLCGYLPMCDLDTQESILAIKVSNLRNKSHLYSKMTTCVSNCPNFIATGVPIGLYGHSGKPCGRPQFFTMSASCPQSLWGHLGYGYNTLSTRISGRVGGVSVGLEVINLLRF